jgi:uncharacterized membrane protein
MTPSALAGDVIVAVFGVLMCTVPAVTRPTVPFGVRVPPAHTDAPVIRRERRTYFWRSAAVAVCCTALAFSLPGPEARWLSRVVLLVEIAANVVCFRLARRKIITAKTTEGWFTGLRPSVVADTSWRTQPQRFPVRWVIPAASVIAATIVIGIIRYPQLPAHLSAGSAALSGHRVPRSIFGAFSVVIAQLYVTGIGTGLMVLVYHSRPDIDAVDPTATLSGYRRLLDAYARALLTMLALIDLTLLLVALQLWQIYQLRGAGAILTVLPALAGLLILVTVAIRAGRRRIRLAAGDGPADPLAAGRDDDRFWKAGLVYVNRADPALVVPARVGVGWTLNLGNRLAWLIIGGIAAIVGGLVLIRVVAGL